MSATYPMLLLLGAAVAQGTSLEVPLGCGDGYGVGELLRAVEVTKSRWTLAGGGGYEVSVNSCGGHPRIGFFFSDRLFGGLLVFSLATNRSRWLDDYEVVLSRSRSTSDQSSWILTLSIIGAMKDAETTCQWGSRSKPLHSLAKGEKRPLSNL
jgi:hypothetical protein